MKPETQTLVIGAVILLLIINTTVLLSVVSSQGAGNQSALPSLNKTNTSVQNNPAVITTKKAVASPTVSTTTSAAPKPGTTSKAVSDKTQTTTAAKSGSSTNSSGTGFLKYSNAPYTFAIDYPANWTVLEMNKTTLATINASRPKKEPGITVVEFYSPSFIRCDEFNKDECVIVRSEVRVDVDPSRNMSKSLDEYFVNETVRLTDGYPIQISRKDAQIYIGGKKAYSLEYHTGASGQTDGIHVIKVYTVMGDRVFIITCHSHDAKIGEVDQFLEYSDDFRHMISTFTFSGNLKVL